MRWPVWINGWREKHLFCCNSSCRSSICFRGTVATVPPKLTKRITPAVCKMAWKQLLDWSAYTNAYPGKSGMVITCWRSLHSCCSVNNGRKDSNPFRRSCAITFFSNRCRVSMANHCAELSCLSGTGKDWVSGRSAEVVSP